MDKFVDGPARKLIAEAKENLLLWTIANRVVQDGILEKREQKVIVEFVGENNLERLKAFLSDVPVSEVHDEVYGKLRAAREDLERIIPTSFEMAYREIEKKMSSSI